MRMFALILVAVGLAFPAHAQTPRVLDGFETLTPWSADASTDVSSTISAVPGHDGKAMRLDYDFNGRSGYAFAARAIDLTIPANYEISFWLRGDMAPNTLEIKFVDGSGDNVHWRQIRGFKANADWTRYTIKARQIIWAWGPKPDRTFRGAERIEFVVTAGEGGKGWIEVDQLELRELPPEPSVPPRPLASASSEDGLNLAARAVDDDPGTAWRTGAAGEQSLTLDLGYEREFGGVTLRWTEGLAASGYRLMASSDRRDWRELAAVTDGNGGVDWLRTPEASARWLRLDLLAPTGDGPSNATQSGAGQMLNARRAGAYALNAFEIEPLSFGETPTTFMRAVADESRRGLYPRGFVGEQPYWTLVGVDGGGESALMGEDGAIELRRGGPSIEPFVIENGRLVTWADVNITQGLMSGSDHLPMPDVTWTGEGWSLKIETFADGTPDNPRLFGRYYLTNLGAAPRILTLALMARPFQVNGPVQFLTTPGGVGPIQQVDWNGAELVLNDALRIRPLMPPDAVAVSTFAAGGDPQALLANAARRRSPRDRLVESDDALAAGALIYEIELQPGQTRQIAWGTAMSGAFAPLPDEPTVEASLDAAQANLAAEWRGKLDRFDLTLPPQAGPVEAVMKSSLAHMLMSRQGPILQPGTRSYNRSWIRDGAMMAEGLNRLGHADLSADYLRWYAPFVFDNGKVPCCVDSRGADPVPENDSHGEFIFLAAETYRYTHDEALLREVWPQVQAAIGHMDTLRASTRTAEFQTAEKRHLFGLLPPTISHEGYSDKIAYSYWDDFWGLLGYRDAAFIADTLGDTAAAARIRAAEAGFRTDIMASIEATARVHGIDWIAGAADRGDFDATSTTIALSPAGLIDELPQGLLKGTFDKWWANFTARQENRQAWKDYTPYELRNVGAMVRLGRREDALRALDFYFADVRPRAWNGWAEVVGRDEREPRFIGDMPHAWISSDYIRSALDLLVYERDRDHALVLAAGVPTAWLAGEGVGVGGVRTPYGPLTYRLREDDGGYTLTLDGQVTPPGGFVIQWPTGETPPPQVRIDGRAASWTGSELAIPASARRVEMR
ncbi:discoidin domain-containing protein [Brevundimonas sp. Root1423]|uniref:discoidin domain-containing protein n=1 Tax=Brevundimonas sp. Root1423 TaxID=1736462 RepID=UPI0006FE7EC2|nr:discoidin domain-containing protein [Brevundimonas sp. Root1423]KQY91742.1 carbohydrate-binding protein [Brevundimonas sp. Root1423]